MTPQFACRADMRPIDKAVVKGKTFSEWAEENKDVLTAHFQ